MKQYGIGTSLRGVFPGFGLFVYYGQVSFTVWLRGVHVASLTAGGLWLGHGTCSHRRIL